MFNIVTADNQVLKQPAISIHKTDTISNVPDYFTATVYLWVECTFFNPKFVYKIVSFFFS